ncbi:MAG TPA: bacteriohemerythrin [Sedimenticola sp.]|nr:bacteriohemerythrin [Sedimenticola sp.]
MPARKESAPSPPDGGKHRLERRRGDRGNEDYFSPEWETKTAISCILDITLKPISFRQQLKEILDVLVSISWLRVEKKGAIFVANSRRELVLAVQHGLPAQLQEACAKIPFGRCLCGKAAATGTILFRDCVDHDHDIRFDGMANHGHYNIPLLANDNETIGVIVLYLEHGHPPHPEEANFMEMLGRTVSNILLNRNLQLRAEINRIRLQKAQLDILHKLVAASEFRDNETGEHIKRMSQYSVVIGRRIGLGDDQLELLEQSAPMHDIGKVGIADEILLKPGRLTAEEFTAMQQHTLIGARILSGSHPLIEASRQIALSHHEKWDGSGYPKGLAGEDIPLFGRICALADVFDALTTKRPYKDAWPLEKALSCIKEDAGTHFDPALVDALLDSLPEILEIKALYDEGNEGGDRKKILEQKPVSNEILTWRDSLSVGVDFMDHQHQYLINLINRIHLAIEQLDTREIVDTLLDMNAYAEVHFAEEEELMRRHRYPGLDAHIRLHQGFIRQAEAFLNDLETAPLATTSEVSRYLIDWLVEHIQKHDSRYGRFIAEQAGQ